MYTKVSWLEGNFPVDLPGYPVIRSVLADSPLMTESSLSQLRVSGGFGTKVPHPTSFEIYTYNLYYSCGIVNNDLWKR